MTSGTVPGILDLEAALYDLGLESLCFKNLLPHCWVLTVSSNMAYLVAVIALKP